jgi:low temperature requirement protein LtrA
MTVAGALQVVLMLGVIWWMYDGYAWLTNAVAPDTTARRLLLLAAMAAFLVLALCIPRAFHGSGAEFGAAYLAIVLIHAGLYSRSSSASVVQAITRVARFNVAAALLVLAGGIAGHAAQAVLWTGALAIEWVATRLAGLGDFEVAPAHFVERHGLVVIVAIGESVVAVGIGASVLPVDAGLAVVAALGLALSACLWWAYFGRDDDVRAERAMAAARPAARPRLALEGFGYWHLLLLLGIVAIAAGEKHAVPVPGHALALADALALGGGVALFLVGDVLFRRTLGLGRSGLRLVAALGALATIALGTGLAAWVQLAALVAVIAGALVAESRNDATTLA